MSPPGHTRRLVASLLEQGVARSDIAARLSISKSTVTYHARRLGLHVDDRCARRYDWDAVQAFHEAGNGMLACMREFSFARQAWADAVHRGAIVPRPRALPIEALLPGVRNRSHVKLRLVAAGLLPDRCDVCGLGEWQGRPITLQLHHINGVGDDNRLQNLQLLCPNCHVQTENWGGRNRRRRSRRAPASGTPTSGTGERLGDEQLGGVHERS